MKNPPRKFEVLCGDSPSSFSRDMVTAAYWSDRYTIEDEPGNFVYFKDSEGKPVLAIATDKVRSIREVRDVPVVEFTWDELRVASTALIEFGRTASEARDSDTMKFRQEAERIGWKLHGADRIVTIPEDPLADIVTRVQAGFLTLDEAREEIKGLRWDEPEDAR